MKKSHESKQRVQSEKNKILSGKYNAIPLFVVIMATIFYLTFEAIVAFFQNLSEIGIDNLTQLVDTLLTNFHVSEVLHSLVINGIFNGIGSVLSFLPIVVTLFFFLSFLEDSGYIARVASVMDKPLRKIGLSGKSIVPMFIGFGCTVPAVMSTRTFPSSRDRKMAILLTPFMSYTTKLPIHAFFINTFFSKYKTLVMVDIYLSNILLGLLVSLIYKIMLFKGEAIPFVMELPNYRMHKKIRTTVDVGQS